jgi:hypothetical protein
MTSVPGWAGALTMQRPAEFIGVLAPAEVSPVRVAARREQLASRHRRFPSSLSPSEVRTINSAFGSAYSKISLDNTTIIFAGVIGALTLVVNMTVLMGEPSP